MKIPSINLLAAATFGLFVVPAASQAATYYWNKTGTADYGTTTNWSDNSASGGTTGIIPTASDVAQFSQSSLTLATTATFNAAGGTTSVGGLIFSNTGTTKLDSNGGNRNLSIGSSGITIDSGAGAVTFTSPGTGNRIRFTLAANQTWTNNSSNLMNIQGNSTITTAGFALTAAGSNNILVNSVISGTGSVVKNGAGTLRLSGANTFSGGVTLNTGTLQLETNTALGATAGALTITGGSLDVDLARTTANNNAMNWDGDFTFVGTNTLNTGTGNVVMNASRQVTVSASTLTVGGVISGSGFGLTKAGAGTLALTGANTYSGGTTITAGTLNTGVASGATLGSGAVTVNGGNLTLNAGAVGSLTGITNFTQTTGSTTFNIASLASFDSIGGSGSFAVNGGTIVLAGTLVGNGTDSYAIFTGFSGNTVGSFTFDTTGLTNLAGRTATLSTGGVLTFTAVPEPSTVFAAAALLGLVGFRQRRRLRGLISTLAMGGNRI